MAPRQKYDKPLNPTLYNRLWERFNGNVQVANAGQPFRYSVQQPRGRLRIVPGPGGSGEEYRVNCPLCKDDRQRCYVNHAFGTKVKGMTIRLVHCFNEDCEGLSSWLDKNLGDVGNCDVTLARAVEEPLVLDIQQLAELSAERHRRLECVQSIAALAPDHPAVLYVERRGLEPRYLAKEFGVGYVGDAVGWPYKRRLFTPVTCRGLEIGWTARIIPNHTPSPPDVREAKYLNSPGMSKSQFLYNLDNARQYDVIAVVEGVTDVWKIGLWGTALMGKNMSESQCEQLCQAASERGAWIVLLGDASTDKDDAAAAWRDNFDRLGKRYPYPKRLRLHLFEQGDPGDRMPQELHDIVNESLYRPLYSQ